MSWDADNVYLIGIETKSKKGAYDTITEIWKKFKVSVYHKADYVDLAIKDFIANI